MYEIPLTTGGAGKNVTSTLLKTKRGKNISVVEIINVLRLKGKLVERDDNNQALMILGTSKLNYNATDLAV